MRSCLICSYDGTNVHRGLRSLFVYQDKSLIVYEISKCSSKVWEIIYLTSEDLTVGSKTTMNYRSEERSGYWQVDTYCYVIFMIGRL